MHRMNGMIGIAVVAALGLAGGLATAQPTAGAAEAGKVSVAGLKIVKPAHDEDQDLRAFNWFAGTMVALLVERPTGGILELNDDESKLESFTDDKGTNLLSGEDKWGRNGVKDSTIAEDGKAAMITIQGSSLPAAGATKLIAKGKVVFNVATKSKTHKSEKVAIKNDQKVTVGGISFTIKEVGKPDWGDAELSLTLKASQDLSAIKTVRFLGADGKEIKSDRGSRMRSAWGNKVTVEWKYDLDKKTDQAVIEVEIWDDMQQVAVPFDIKTSIGLGSD